MVEGILLTESNLPESCQLGSNWLRYRSTRIHEVNAWPQKDTKNSTENDWTYVLKFRAVDILVYNWQKYGWTQQAISDAKWCSIINSLPFPYSLKSSWGWGNIFNVLRSLLLPSFWLNDLSVSSLLLSHSALHWVNCTHISFPL